MIKYDYIIERQEEDEKVVYKPSLIPKELDNLVCIEGPNSSGKSTLLTILALGFFGLENDKIHQSLRKKMGNLLKAKHQKIKFKIEVTDQDNSLRLVSEKKDFNNNEIVVRELTGKKETPLISESFHRKYNLVYDIPDNPTERLNKLTEQIKSLQKDYGGRVSALTEYIRVIISDIRDSRDPRRLSELKKELKRLEEEKANLKEGIEELENLFDILENSVYYKLYQEYKSKYDEKDEQIETLKKNEKNLKKDIRDDKGEFENSSRELRNRFLTLYKLFGQINELLNELIQKKDRFHFDRWKKIELSSCLSDLEFPDNIREDIKIFKDILSKLQEEKNKDNALKEAEMITSLIDVLNDYKNFDFKIPTINKSVSEFIKDLEILKFEREYLIKISTNINQALQLLDEFNDRRREVENDFFPVLKKLKKEQSEKQKEFSKYRSINQQINQFQEELEEIKEKLEEYKQEYYRKGQPKFNEICPIGQRELKKYAGYIEQQLIDAIKELDELIKDKKAEFDNLKEQIIRRSHDIGILEKKKPHKYQEYLNELEILHEKSRSVVAKLKNRFDTYIHKIIEERFEDLGNASEEQLKYNKAVFSYLGKRIGVIRHIEGEYEVEYVDLINGFVKTREGKVIRLADMGTGQSQSAYLMGLLNLANNKKTIALFDEVAMMDTKSLEPIYKKFQDMYKRKEILVGIVVQKADKVRVISKT